MSDREIDVDGLFDRDADTQLLQRRRRQELGLTGDIAPVSGAAVRFGPESILRDEAPAPRRAAMLRVALDARPNRELIPGAIVTVVATVHDDGESDAPDVLLRIAVPAECEALPGSGARDDTPLDEQALLGEGVRIGAVGAGQAVRVRFAVRVLPGTGALHVIAHASAPSVPTIAAPALRLTRRAGHTAFDAPRPFFELETNEAYERVPAAPAAPPPPPRTVDAIVDEPAAPQIAPSPPATPEPVVAEQLVPEPAVSEPIVAEAVVAEPAVAPQPPDDVIAHEVIAPAVIVVKRSKRKPAEPPASEPKPAPPAAAAPAPKTEPKPKRPRKRPVPRAEPPPEPQPERDQPYVFARMLEDDGVRGLERIFTGAVPHGLAALSVLTSIAAVDTPLGDALGVREFARDVAAALPRALIAARLSQPLPSVVTRESLDVIRPSADAPSEPFPQYFPLLVTRLDERELGALRTVLARDLDDVFLRGVQVLLAVAPRAIEGVAPEAAASARDALAAYRVAAGGWLMRVTVRRAVDRRYDPLVAGDASLHEAGRVLIAALRAALA